MSLKTVVQTFFRSKSKLPWEYGEVSTENPTISALLSLQGIRRLRVLTLADSTDILIDPNDSNSAAITRCLIVSTGASPILNLVAADDDATVGGDGLGGPCQVPLPANSVSLMSIQAKQAWATNSTGITKIIGGF